MGRVTITLKGKKKPIPEPKKGPILPVYDVDYLPRRGGGIQFYDLGQTWNGASWNDLDYSYLSVSENLGSGAGRFAKAQIPFSEVENFQDLILSVDIDDWETYYRKLGYEDAERYGLTVASSVPGASTGYHVGRNGAPTVFGTTIADTKWTRSGLKIPSFGAGFGAIHAGMAFERFAPTANYFKVTATPDYSAAAVTDFGLSNKAKVFLVPRLINQLSLATNIANSWGAVELFNSFQIASREFWLDRADTGITQPFFTVNNHSLLSDLDATNATALVSLLKADASAKAYLTTEDLGSPPNGILSTSSVASFPPAVDALNYRAGRNLFHALTQNIQMTKYYRDVDDFTTDQIPYPGSLVGVVKQQGNVYYFWTHTSFYTLDSSWSFRLDVIM